MRHPAGPQFVMSANGHSSLFSHAFTRQGERAISGYESVLALTGEMLETARRSDWEALLSLEMECRKLLQNLIALENGQGLDSEQRIRKGEIIREILARDAEIRKLAIQGMERLEQVLGGLVQKKKLNQTYKLR